MESHRIIGHLAWWPVWLSDAADISGRAAHSHVIGHMAAVVGRGFVAVVVRRARSALECMPLEPRGGQVRDQVGLQRLRQEGHPATHKLRGENAALANIHSVLRAHTEWSSLTIAKGLNVNIGSIICCDLTILLQFSYHFCADLRRKIYLCKLLLVHIHFIIGHVYSQIRLCTNEYPPGQCILYIV